MDATLYLPYVNGDPSRDYKYRGREISTEEYVKLHEKEYTSKKFGVDTMMHTRFCHNMSINNYDKKKVNVRKVAYSYFECPCRLLPVKGGSLTLADLRQAAANNKKILALVLLDKDYVEDQPELTVELNSWLKQSKKILKEPRLSNEEKIFHLPKKDLQIYTDDDTPLLLKDCKIVETKNTMRNFVILINSVYMGKDMLRIKEAAAKV